MYISVESLAFIFICFMLFCLLIVLGVFLVVALYNFNNFIKQAKRMVEKNGENIDKALAMLPDMIKNMNETALSIKGNVDKAGTAIGKLEGTVSETAAALGENTESILTIIKIVSSIIKAILNMFSKE